MAESTTGPASTGRWDIGGPGPGTASDRFKNSEHVPHQAAFVHPTETEMGQGKNAYKAAMCDAAVCLSCHRAWKDAAITGAAIYPRLVSAESPIVAIRLVEGEAKEGQNAVILPEELAGPELEQVQQVFDKYAVRMQSGRVIFDVDSFNADAPPERPF